MPWDESVLEGEQSGFDHVTLDIRNAFFAWSEEREFGGETVEPRIQLVLQGPATTVEGNVFDDHEQRFGIGSGKKITEDGASVTYADEVEARKKEGKVAFSAQCGYYWFFLKAVEVAPWIRDGDGPEHAHIWKGLRVELERRKAVDKQGRARTLRDGSALTFMTPIHVEKGTSAQSGGQTSGQAAAQAPAADGTVDNATLLKIRAKAKENGSDFSTWLEYCAVELGMDPGDPLLTQAEFERIKAG